MKKLLPAGLSIFLIMTISVRCWSSPNTVACDDGSACMDGDMPDGGVVTDAGQQICIPDSRLCWSGTQVAVCAADGSKWEITSCNPDETCVGGSCQGTGVDAGFPDTEIPDANLQDAGLDDAGPTDAGTDAGHPDSGTADSGLQDGGPADAGTADAGGPTDGGQYVCTPGDTFCVDATTIATCKEDATGYGTASCPSGYPCSFGMCQAIPVDGGSTDAGFDSGMTGAGVLIDAGGTVPDSGTGDGTGGCGCTTVGVAGQVSHWVLPWPLR